jgi:TolA-binding protein
MKQHLILGISFILISLSVSGCLKTRADLKSDSDDTPAAPAGKGAVPNPVSDVTPTGGYALDEVKSEITRLSGRMDDVERGQKDQAAGKSAATDDQQKKLEDRITQLEQAQANMLEAIKKIQDTTAVDPIELFEKAKAEYDHQNWDGALEPLNGYLKGQKTTKAEEAYFMRAECYFHTEKYKLAIADYSEFPEKYTKSKHMPEALYRIGLSFEALGSPDDAKGFYQLLVDKFPKSSQAKKIKSKLK